MKTENVLFHSENCFQLWPIRRHEISSDFILGTVLNIHFISTSHNERSLAIDVGLAVFRTENCSLLLPITWRVISMNCSQLGNEFCRNVSLYKQAIITFLSDFSECYKIKHDDRFPSSIYRAPSQPALCNENVCHRKWKQPHKTNSNKGRHSVLFLCSFSASILLCMLSSAPTRFHTK